MVYDKSPTGYYTHIEGLKFPTCLASVASMELISRLKDKDSAQIEGYCYVHDTVEKLVGNLMDFKVDLQQYTLELLTYFI